MNEIIRQLQQARADAALQWAASLRLRLGCYAIGLILMLYAALVITDEVAAKQEQFSQISTRLLKIQRLAEDDRWEQRLQSEQATWDSWQQRLWLADSPSLARATVQAEFENIGRELALRAAQVRVGELEQQGPVYTIDVELRAQYRRDAATRLITWLAEHPKLLTINRLEVQLAGNRRIDLMLTAYVLVGE